MRAAFGLVLLILLLGPAALAGDSISGLWEEISTPVKYSHSTTRGPSKWESYGVHELTLSPDGKTMTGTWKNQRQESGPLKFIRKK